MSFSCEVVKQAQDKNLTSDEHFTVDGTLMEAWASLKSFQRKDTRIKPPDDPGNPTVDFHGEKRCNAHSRIHYRSPMRCWHARATARKRS